MIIKKVIKTTLKAIHLDITSNMKYERLTEKIIERCVTNSTICVDIGCHKGEVLDLFIKQAPNIQHYGFEPIPELYNYIFQRYGERSKLFNIALSDETCETTFNYVRNAPAFSGLRQRDYAISNPEIDIINVKLDKLDNIIPQRDRIGFIKIDVEGAEFSVLKGAEFTIDRCKPYILFEFGLGGSDYYDTTPSDIFEYFSKKNMGISLLKDWLDDKQPLDLANLKGHFNKNSEYYFLAHKLL